MESCGPGEVIRLAFPFVNATEVKRGHALVLLDTGDEDLIVACMTSRIAQTVYDVEFVGWQHEGLLPPSAVRVHKVATIEKRLVERRLGMVTPSDWGQVRARIQQLWATI